MGENNTPGNSASKITDTKRLEALRQSQLLDSAIEESFDRLTRLASKLLKVPVSLVSLVDEDRQFFKSQIGLAEPWASARETPLTHSFCKYVVAEENPLIIEDARTHPLLKDNLAIPELGVVAYAGIPLVSPDGRTLGSFCAIDNKPHTWTEEEISILNDLAASVMTEIEMRYLTLRAQHNSARANIERENKLALLNATKEGIYGIDLHGRCTFINRAALEMLGYSEEEALGANMHRLIHHSYENGRPYFEKDCPVFKAFQLGTSSRSENEALWRKDGTSFKVLYSSAPLHINGEIRGAVVSFADITQWQRAMKRLQLQHAISRVLAEAVDLDAAAPTLLQTIGEALDWEVGAIWQVNSEKEQLDSAITWQSSESNYDDFEDATRAMVLKKKEGFPGQIWADGKPMWVTDVQKESNFLRAYLAEKAGLHGAVIFPVGSHTQILAVIEFFSSRMEKPDPDLIESVFSLSRQIGLFIERTQTQATLRQSEALKSSILDTALDCIITMDHLGRVLEWNPAAEYTFGYTREEAMGHEMAELIIPPALQRLHREGLAKFLETGEGPVIGNRIEISAIRADGSEFPVELTVTHLSLDGTSIFTGYVRDITVRKQVESELREAKDAAEIANAAKSQFLANMSHELRTPLNAVIGYSEMLQEEAAELGLMDFGPDLEKIHVAGRHLLALINDVLDLSKIEAGKMELYLENFDVVLLLEEVKSTIQPLVAKNENSLTVNCSPNLGSMYSDLTKVRQGIFNLLSNAAKFTNQGMITLDIFRQQENGKDWITFTVADTGIGMSPEQVEKLFEPFSQADCSTSRRFGGTGLGLAITRSFCEMMGGSISLDSELNRGSTFTIRLPAVVGTAMEGSSIAMHHEHDQVQSEAEIMPGKLILVIDDDPVARDIMARSLSRAGYAVRSASSGEEGLRLARQLRPVAITLDILMPSMDGWTVLSTLKADPELSAIPVIMVSIVGNANLCYALGASDHLMKPVDREQLINVLRKHLPSNPSLPILIVDDDEGTRQLLRSSLEREGWLVAEAENGRAALEQLVTLQPTLLLVDLMMPEMDGLELIAQLRQSEAWRSIPIVVITAKDLSLQERMQLKGSVNSLLQKGSYSQDELLREVRTLVADAVGH